MKPRIITLALAVVLAACGSGDGDEVSNIDTTPETTITVDDTAALEAQLLDLAACMRANGLPDFPDPTVAADGTIQVFPGGPPEDLDPDGLARAQEACADLIDDVVIGFLPEDTTELEDRFLAFAECMRDNGVDMPDPDFSAGFFPGPGGGGIFGDIDPEDPAFQEAADACSYLFEGLFPGVGGGPGGG